MAAVAVSGACRPARQFAARYPRPDTATIYRVEQVEEGRNPLLLIPGFGGSRLTQADGSVVWGSLFNHEALSFGKREGLTALALDTASLPAVFDQRDLAWLDDDTAAGPMLERFVTGFLGTDLTFPVYSPLIATVRRGGYVAVTDTSADPRATPYFSFGYDWRQDNVTNAVALGRFIEEARLTVAERRRQAGMPDRPIRFDVVAHSMGGLIARYYLLHGPHDILDDPAAPVTWAGAADIERLVLVSPPNYGTMKALRNLVLGRTHPVVPTFHPAMTATWTAVYQLLPRPEHPLWVDDAGLPAELPQFTGRLFRENGWGPFAPKQERFLEWIYPAIPSPGERRDRMEALMDAGFERARRFYAVLDGDGPSPCPVPIFLFAGDANPTLARAIVRHVDGRLVLDFDKPEKRNLVAAGDGTVTRASALADRRMLGGSGGWLRSPVPWSRAFFVNERHNTFLSHPAFQDNLLHLLVDTPPERDRLRPPDS